MPKGVEVLIENGFATVSARSRAVRNDVLKAILEHTPAELIRKNTRSGPFTTYTIPVGNAEAAGLIDGNVVSELIDRSDLHFAEELAAANVQDGQDWEWHNPQPTVKGSAYVGGRDGANGAISGPLRPNKPVASAPEPPAGASITSANLQDYVRENTPNPADYAPSRSTPRNERAGDGQGQATIASVVTNPSTTSAPASPPVAGSDARSEPAKRPATKKSPAKKAAAKKAASS